MALVNFGSFVSGLLHCSNDSQIASVFKRAYLYSCLYMHQTNTSVECVTLTKYYRTDGGIFQNGSSDSSW